MPKTKVYLAGPMRGYPEFNFPAFDRWSKHLRELGFEVISPAEMDRQNGFCEKTATQEDVEQLHLHDMILRDLEAIARECDGVAVMPGWRKSRGANLEVQLARFLSRPVYDATTGELLVESVCEEAHRLTHTDRNEDYGHPLDNFHHTAALWRSMFGWKCSWREVAQAMILVKLSRQRHKPKRDNLTDICGYANCESMAELEEAMRAGEVV